MKTVKEVAKELNISPQTIYKKIRKTHRAQLMNFIKVKKSKIFINDQGIKIIKDSLKDLNTGNTLNTLNTLNQSDVAARADYKNRREKAADAEKFKTSGALNSLNTLNQDDEKNDIINIMSREIEDLKKRLDISQEIIKSQQETIKQQQISNSQQIQGLQILLREEQEKNSKLLPGKSSEISEKSENLNDSKGSKKNTYDAKEKKESLFRRIFPFLKKSARVRKG